MSDIVYLENSDFDAKGQMIHDMSRPVIIMIYGDGCPHCVRAKPEYAKFAAANPGVMSAVIATDGQEADSALVARLPKFIPNLRGIPTFVLYRNGVYVKTFNGPHTAAEFKKFANS